ncbi:Gfo/Idh/MocA family oxidoreductase [Glutamicibacter mishrai]|uniref:Gfo/Idh/MocA family oxidoreductase n=1 Tax=Glutamicibacter mishrai TaxID=1775880 RepID=UPI003F797363
MQKFALIGAGFIGSVHAHNLAANPAVDFKWVYDLDTQRAATLATRYGASLAQSLEQIFSDNELDAVFIASSTDSHAQNLRLAADAGLAALVEKPIDLHLETAKSTVAYVERSGIRAMVNFNRRFDRAHAELRECVRTGKIGDVSLLQLTSRGPALPPVDYLRTSGGQFRDQAVHFYDLARWITGEDPVQVHAYGSALTAPEIAEFGDVDTSISSLLFAGGGLAQIDCVRHTNYGYDERIEALGSEGMVESERQPSGHVTVFQGETRQSHGLHGNWFDRIQPTYAASLDAFVQALEEDREVPITLREGLKSQAIAQAAGRSVASGRSEVIDYSL